MSEGQGADPFVAKWRERWPEWSVAEAFVPSQEREIAPAWFALLQELTDAAWAGDDPRPGEAKLGWWMEELHGWSQRRRRHPIGQLLQPLAAPWAELAAALPALLAARDAAVDRAQAFDVLQPVARAIASTGESLFGGSTSSPAVAPLLAQHLLLRGDATAPLSIRARLGQGQPDLALARAWAGEILAGWDSRIGSRTGRVGDVLLRQRLERFHDSGRLGQPVGRLRTVWCCWRAARG